MEGFFSGVFGNEPTKKRISTAILSDTLAHAFLICGPDGSGKMTLAKEIAAALNCERRHDEKTPFPCHSCNSCRRIFADGFTDIKTLRKPNDKATIGVGEIRIFREDMFLSATESDYKIYIIDDAEKMTPNAQNALLKVLEEPPSNVLIFLLSASDDAILATIKSRTQYISMERFDEDALMRYFGNEAAGQGEVLMCADGCIGRAKELLFDGKEDAKQMRKTTENILRAIKPGTPYSELYLAIKALPSKKNELTEALENLAVALRDLILLKFDKTAPLSFFTSRETGVSIAAQSTAKRLVAIYDVVKDATTDIYKNANTNATITSLGAKIKLI